jgi:prolyl oligopeptidase
MTDGGGTRRRRLPPACDERGNTPDPYLWLEDVTGEGARLRAAKCRRGAGVEGLNFQSTASGYDLQLADRILCPERGRFYYNFDDRKIGGLWRRTTFEEDRKRTELGHLDVDALAKQEKEWIGKARNSEPDCNGALVSLAWRRDPATAS